MNKPTILQPKVIIANLLFIIISTQIGFSQGREKLGEELLFFVTEEYGSTVHVNVTKKWESSYDDLNPVNPIYPPWPSKFGDFDLDSLFNESQITTLENQLNNHSEIDAKKLNKSLSNSKNKKENVFITISFPLISKGKGDCIYGIVKVTKVFNNEGETSYKYYRKCDGEWEFLHSHLLSSS